MMGLQRKLLLVFCVLFIGKCFAQRYNFDYYSLESGLPQSSVFEIFQDQRGFLWLGTDGGGAVQFDGQKFNVINKRDGLAGNSVRAINQDKAGNLWIGTEKGLSIYNGKTIKNLKPSANLSSTAVYKIFIDKNQNVWVSYPGSGLLKYKNVNDTTPKLFTTDNGLSINFIFDIIELSDDELILATYNGINILNVKSEKVRVFSTEEGIPSAKILCVEKDNDGNCWFGSIDAPPFYIHEKYLKQITLLKNEINILKDFPDKRINDISKRNDELFFATYNAGIISIKNKQIREYNSSNGLPTNQVLKLFMDNLGLVWAGTSGKGLCKFSGTAFSHLSINDASNGEEQVFSILQDKNKNIWAAGFGGGLSKISYKAGKATIEKIFTEKDGLPGNFLTALSLDSTGNLWIGTKDKGIAVYDGKKFSYLTEKNGLSSNNISSIYRDSKNRVWVSTDNGVTKIENKNFDHSNESNGLINNEVQSVMEDRLGNIWIATLGGLAKYDGATIDNFNEQEGLLETRINCLAVNKRNEILIGTFGGGIYFADVNRQGKPKFILLTGDSTLSSNNIHGICFVNDDEIIVSTDKGIDNLAFKDKKLSRKKSFDKTDGFTSIENNLNAILKIEDDLFAFGTIQGITFFDSKNLALNLNPPKPQLIDIKLFYKSIDWHQKGYGGLDWNSFPESFKLKYDENNLTFYFHAINFSNPNKVKYKYKLIGIDKDWLSLFNLHEVNYPVLNSGQYTFMVMACNENNIWSQPLTLKFTILPPFYKTWWFISLLIISVILIIISYVKWRESELKKKNIKLERTVTERTEEISEQKKEIEEKNKDITDSIIYARRIQKAILPPEEKIRLHVKNSYVLFQPKDIIGGDFYYFNFLDKNGKLIQDENTKARYHVIAVADCTGHGVPGALMSMIGYNGLNYALSKSINSGETLDILSSFVEQFLGTHSEETIKDGMDITLCVIDLELRILNFSGANNPLYILRKPGSPAVEGSVPVNFDAVSNGEKIIYEIKADKQPVGAFDHKKKFTSNKVVLFEEDELILFTDGFADQFGGPEGKKFKYSSLKRLLLSICNLPHDKQKEELQKIFKEWKGSLEQVDDVCIIGISPV